MEREEKGKKQWIKKDHGAMDEPSSE